MPDPEQPIELLDLADGQSVSFVPIRAQLFSPYRITPAHQPEGKDVDLLRVYVTPESKSFPPWYDVTSRRLIAQLTPLLPLGTVGQRRVTIRAYGIPPKKYFSVELAGA